MTLFVVASSTVTEFEPKLATQARVLDRRNSEAHRVHAPHQRFQIWQHLDSELRGDGPGTFRVRIENPMAASQEEADQLIAAAARQGRVLQVGHLERFNPAIVAVQEIVSRPLFFEVHRLGVFSPRSLDVDVVYDVMIHDLDILLALAASPVKDLKSVGIPILTDKVDIAHARIEFESGAVANVTASRVSTERVRKMRFFQEHEYVSVDYTRQDALRVRVLSTAQEGQQPQFNFENLPTHPEEPLRAELREFLDCVRTRRAPRVDGAAGRRALELADRVMAGILEHARRVQLPGALPQADR